jgi:hypothetical protein
VAAQHHGYAAGRGQVVFNQKDTHCYLLAINETAIPPERAEGHTFFIMTCIKSENEKVFAKDVPLIGKTSY